MTLTEARPEQIRFGEFALNPRTRELTSNGTTLDLQEQPFLVLTALLEHPGELIPREQLVQKLWPADTHVDFEHSLNKAVKRLREALKDSAESPRFVETLPRRGYRFIGTVLPVDARVDGNKVYGRSATVDSTPKNSGAPPWRRFAAVGSAVLAGMAAFTFIWLVPREHPQVSSSNSPGQIRSLVILPLENLSGDPAQEYFAEGMTDELTTILGQIGSLKVISRTSATQYKHANKQLRQIANELGVDAVVEGSVVRSGDRVRITAQLIDATSDKHLWAQSYEGEAKDVLGIQNKVAQAIADQIRVKFTREQRASLSADRPVNPVAHELYLKGIREKWDAEGRSRAEEDFKKAIALDPNYVVAHVALARFYIRVGHMLVEPPQVAFPPALEAINRALAVDDSSADAHLGASSLAFLYEWDFAKSRREIQKALELNPNSAGAHAYYAEWLVATGKPGQGVAEARKFASLDPTSLDAMGELGTILYWAGRYDESIAESKSKLAVQPDDFYGHLYLGLCLEAKGNYSEAIDELQKVAVWGGKSFTGFLAHAKAASGDHAGPHQYLREMQERSKHEYVSPWWIALVYTGLGDKEKAFEYLERSYRGREHDLAYMNAWPQFDPLRSDPRWMDLMRRVGLPDRLKK